MVYRTHSANGYIVLGFGVERYCWLEFQEAPRLPFGPKYALFNSYSRGCRALRTTSSMHIELIVFFEIKWSEDSSMTSATSFKLYKAAGAERTHYISRFTSDWLYMLAGRISFVIVDQARSRRSIEHADKEVGFFWPGSKQSLHPWRTGKILKSRFRALLWADARRFSTCKMERPGKPNTPPVFLCIHLKFVEITHPAFVQSTDSVFKLNKQMSHFSKKWQNTHYRFSEGIIPKQCMISSHNLGLILVPPLHEWKLEPRKNFRFLVHFHHLTFASEIIIRYFVMSVSAPEKKRFIFVHSSPAVNTSISWYSLPPEETW